MSEFSPAPVVGLVVLVLAASALRRLRGCDEAGRVLALALLLSTIAIVAHPYKQPRFLFLTATLLWFAGSREAVELVARATRRFSESAQRWAFAAGAAAILLTAAVSAVDGDRLLRGHRRNTVDASTIEVLDAITERAAAVQTSVLLGSWNHLSPWLVEWSCLQRRPPMDPDQVPREPSGRARRGDLLGWLADDPPGLVMIVSASPGSQPRPGFIEENRRLEPVRRQLARDPLFDLVSREDFPTAPYRLESFEPIRARAQPVPR